MCLNSLKIFFFSSGTSATSSGVSVPADLSAVLGRGQFPTVPPLLAELGTDVVELSRSPGSVFTTGTSATSSGVSVPADSSAALVGGQFCLYHLS